MRKFACFALVTLFANGALLVRGDDSSASMAAGGIQLRREARISMEKERLEIGLDKVAVEFEFLNESDSDITTEVAFQFPSYGHGANEESITDVRKFHVWVEGKELQYETQIRAMANGKDQTKALRKFGIDVVSLDADPSYDGIEEALSLSQQKEMFALGLIDKNQLPQWTVEKLSYWRQTFPAHKILHVRHEYTPATGFFPLEAGDLDLKRTHRPEQELERVPDLYKQIEKACVDPGLRKSLGALDKPSNPVEMVWVDYVLTTANSWKTPIKDFTLVLDRPPVLESGKSRTFVSLCWDGPIVRLDADHFQARQTNFVPRKELHVAFLSSSVN